MGLFGVKDMYAAEPQIRELGQVPGRRGEYSGGRERRECCGSHSQPRTSSCSAQPALLQSSQLYWQLQCSLAQWEGLGRRSNPRCSLALPCSHRYTSRTLKFGDTM